jgi:hypothetical protein
MTIMSACIYNVVIQLDLTGYPRLSDGASRARPGSRTRALHLLQAHRGTGCSIGQPSRVGNLAGSARPRHAPGRPAPADAPAFPSRSSRHVPSRAITVRRSNARPTRRPPGSHVRHRCRRRALARARVARGCRSGRCDTRRPCACASATHSGAVPSFHSIDAPPTNRPPKCGSTSATCAGVIPSWTTRYCTGSSGGGGVARRKSCARWPDSPAESGRSSFFFLSLGLQA